MTTTREEIVKNLLWYDPQTYKVDQRQRNENNDVVSVVAVGGPPERYTDEELVEIGKFSERHTAAYDKHWKRRVGANYILINKESDRWYRARVTWTMGPMSSPTLQEALAVFDRQEQLA